MAANPFDSFARLYDWEHDPYTEDLEAHLAFARRFGGPVLELACGTGRLLRPLVDAGFTCAGVDSSPAMLDRARRRLGPDVRLENQSLEHLDLDGTYRTIILALDSLALLLSADEQREVLWRARQHVAHDGRLILDLSNGNLRGGPEATDELIHHLTAPDPKTGRLITKWVSRRSDPSEQIDDMLLFFDETDAEHHLVRTIVPLRIRWFTRFEVQLLLEATGWTLSELYGDYTLAPYVASSERILAVAAAAG